MTSDTLALADAERQLGHHDGKTSRRFLDFLVNGEDLARKVQSAGYDLISCLWLDNATAAPESVKAAQRLLGRVAGDAPHGRVTVHVCAECGDLGCGAITVRLEVIEDRVVWDDWGYQNNDEDEIFDLDDVRGLCRFVFDRPEYEHVLSRAVERIRTAR